MRKQIKAVAYLLLGTILLTGCGGFSAGSDFTAVSGGSVSGGSVSGSSVSGAGIEQKPESDVETDSPYCMEISVGRENQVSVPDPAVPGTARISLNKEAEDLWEELSEEQRSLYFADLSFAGFEEPVLVTSYAVGCMAKKDASVVQVKYADSGKTKQKKGNCLALFVTEGVRTGSESPTHGDEDSEVKNYVLVLDYANQTYYKKETGMFLHEISNWCTMKFADLTGDGNEELFMKHLYNKSVCFGVWQSEEGTHELNRLFCTLGDVGWSEKEDPDDDDDDRDSFSWKLLDGYKVKLQYKDIGYSQTVSMINDGGYREEMLQVGADDTEFVALWKNGILQKELVDEETVFLYAIDHVGIEKEKKGKSKIELVRGICVGHRSEGIGNIHLSLKYDKKSQKLVPGSVRYVPEEEAMREFETFEEWEEQ